MSWQTLIVIAVISLSVSVLLRRLLLHQDKSDPIAFVIVFQGLVGLITLVYALVHGFQMPDFRLYWLPILLTILLFAVANVVSAEVLKRVEASVYSVLFATSAIWTMVAGAYMFGDHLTVTQYVGAALVFASVLIVAEGKGKFKLNAGILLGLLMGLLLGLATAGWIYMSRRADVASWNAISFIGPALVVLLFRPKAIHRMKPLFSGRMLTRVTLSAIVFSVYATALILSYNRGNVSIVAVLQQTAIILTTLLGIVFLRERDRLWRKGLAALVCFVAVLLIIQ